MKIGLGTVQFGLDYGISNRNGRPTTEEIADILRLAVEKGVDLLDTAPAYGCSEQVLGKCQETRNFAIVTKTAQFAGPVITPADANDLRAFLRASLDRLGIPNLYGLLIHNADDVAKPNGELLLVTMADLKRQGLIQKIGVSVYNQRQIELVLKKHPVDLIQLPINVLDQRLLASGYLTSLKNTGIEIHVRSVFLQGLLLMPPSLLPQHFQTIYPLMEKYHRLLADINVTPLRAAINFVKQQKAVDYIITGVNSTSELAEIIEAFESAEEIDIDFSEYACFSESIINPSCWK